MVCAWENLFLEVLDVHAPLRTTMKNNPSPWLTPEIKTLMHRRDHLKKKSIANNSKSTFEAYETVRNQVNAAIKKAKVNDLATEVNNDTQGSRHTWKAINTLHGRKSKVTGITQLKVEESVITDSVSISDILNEHFTSIGTKISNSDFARDLCYTK